MVIIYTEKNVNFLEGISNILMSALALCRKSLYFLSNPSVSLNKLLLFPAMTSISVKFHFLIAVFLLIERLVDKECLILCLKTRIRTPLRDFA